MILKFDYKMQNSFTRPIYNHHFLLMCIPMETMRQRLCDFSLQINPCSYQAEDKDFFGNSYCYGETLEPHSSFTVHLSGTVETGLSVCEAVDSKHLELFSLQSTFTRCNNSLLAFCNDLNYNTTDDAYEKAIRLMRGVHSVMEYVPGATTVKSTAADAFEIRKGVCQDYAHIMLSLLRQSNIPSRYVVGMLKGEGASHAWVEANCKGYWYGFDPTNNLLVNDDYIKISHGRDYEDCIVHRGSFKNLCGERQSVKVLVEEQ